MWKEAASAIYDIVSLLLNDEVSAAKRGLFSKISEAVHRKKIRKYCYDFTRNHNGTVLTNPIFSQWLQNDETINRLFQYTGSTHISQTDTEYIEAETFRIKQNIEYPVNAEDLSAIKGFLCGLLIEHRKYREKYLSNDSRQIIQTVDKSALNLRESIDSSNEEIKEMLSLISGKNDLSPNEEYNVFQSLNSCFWEGNFTLLVNMLTALHNKSRNLEIWLSFVLSMVLIDGEKYRTDDSIMDINNLGIREDSIRKQIIFTYLQDGCLKNCDYHFTGELGELINRLIEGDSWLFNETREIKEGLDCYNLSPFASLNTEKETITYLQVIYIFKKNYAGVSKVIDSLVGNNKKTFLISLLQKAKHYTESISTFENEEQAIMLSEQIINELWDSREIYSYTSACIQNIYWRIMLQAFSISDKCRIPEIINCIPKKIQNELSDCILMARLSNNDVTDDEVVDVWEKTRNYVPINAFLMGLNSIKAEEFVKKSIPSALEYPEIVLSLATLHIRDNNNEEALMLLEYHREKCLDYAEYYINCIQISDRSEDVETLANKWEHRDLIYSHFQTDAMIAHIMYDHKRYDVCLKVLNALEVKGIVRSELRKMKGFALINTGKVIEGLDVLNKLIPERQDDVSVIGNILNCSLGLQRDVSDEVIKAADKMAVPEIMLYLADVFERRGDVPTARKYLWKALILNHDDKSKVYGFYWGFAIRHFVGDGKVDTSIEESCIYASQVDGNDNIVIGILSRDYVEDETQIENITLVSTDSAIRNGWYNKKIGANITYCGSAYKIIDITTVETGLSRMCCNKLVSTGAAKAIAMPKNSTPEQMRANLVSFIKKNTTRENKNSELFNEYKNLSQLPLSLYGLSHSFNSTFIAFVYNIIKDPSVLVREWINYDVVNHDNSKGYVLSFSALILLFLLNVPTENLKNKNVFIPQSLIVQIREEKEIVISENRCDVGSVSVVDNRLRFLSKSDEIKQELMTFAIDLLEYAEKIPAIESKRDYVIESIPELQLRSLLGTPDLDALSICKEYEYSLVTFEVWLSEINLISRQNVITVLDLLNSIENDDLSFLEYLKKAISFRMMNILDKESLNRIADSEKPEIIESWKQYINMIENQDDDYKKWLKEHLPFVNQKYQEKRDKNKAINDIERIFFDLLLSLLEREVHVSTGTLRDKEGNVVLRAYMRVFDKKQQKYLEGLDRIVDTVIRIDISSSPEE